MRAFIALLAKYIPTYIFMGHYASYRLAGVRLIKSYSLHLDTFSVQPPQQRNIAFASALQMVKCVHNVYYICTNGYYGYESASVDRIRSTCAL